MPTDRGEDSRNAARYGLAVLALTIAALVLRLWTLPFALPFAQEPDPHILGQIQTLSQKDVSERDLFFSSIYPHLIARTAIALGDVTQEPSDMASMTLEQHLAAAGRLHMRVRRIVAFFSVLLVPATWWVARFFLERKWALFAAALAAASTLSLQFGQMARPHAAVAPLIAISIAASLRLRRRGDTASFVIAGFAAALAIACLTNGFAVLLPALLAYLLRNHAPRRILDARLLIPIAVIALAVWIFYPFFFVPRPEDAQTPAGEVGFANQSIDPKQFVGRGFPTLFMTFWYYEPVALVLSLVGFVAWIARGRDRTPEASERRKDLAVVLSFALLYAICIGLYERNQQRFSLPLVPFTACLAAYGMRALAAKLAVGKLSRAPATCVAVIALSIPSLACLGYTSMRTHPQTLEQASRWLRSHVDPASQRIALHLNYDVPLPRRHENLFRPDGQPRKVNLSPWQVYQERWLDAVWSGERWDITSLFEDRARWAAIAADPEAYVRSLDVDYVIVPGGGGPGVNPLVKSVRDVLARIGELVLSLPDEERPPTSGLEGLDTPHFTYFVLTAHSFGPQLDVYRLPRAVSSKR
jgi:hypothetical protein